MSWKNVAATLLIPVLSLAACAGDDPPAPEEPQDVISDPPEQPVNDPPENEPQEEEPEAECPYTGEPPIPLSTIEASMPACPSYMCGGGAHCVPNVLLPDDPSVELLESCNDESTCVPDNIIMAGPDGNFLLDTCTAVMGVEGRCMSPCVPDVRAQAELLKQDTCSEHQLCVPCFNPLTGEDTGVCNLTCDAGPTEPPHPELPTCCGDDSGTCVPTEALPQRAIDGLTQKSCEEQSMCVPNVMLDTTFEGEPCAPDIILQMLGIDDGACLPECLDAVSGIGRGSCGPGYKCAPCDALGESTGACGDPW